MLRGFLFAGWTLSGLLGALAAEPSKLWGREGELWDPGGRLPDFSYAGYHRGERPIPDLPAGISVKSFGARGDGETDDTDAFKRAIQGHAGRVIEIPAGRYHLSDILDVRAPGVVFRGAGRDRTVLYFPKPLHEVRPNMGATTGGRPTSNYSWSGGFLWFRGSFGARAPVRITAEARRGDRSIELDSTRSLQVGLWVDVTVRDTETNSLARHLYAEDAGPMGELKGRTRASLVARITAIDANRVRLDRPLRFDIRGEWQPELREFAPTVTECGVEDLTFEFPVTPYAGHFTELGFNPVALTGVANCWVRRVRFLNADSGPMVGGRFNTLEDLLYESRRPADGGGHAGHHGVDIGGDDNLFTRFDFRCRFIHDLTVSHCAGNVFSTGRADDLCLDHHKRAPYENLFTDLDAGAGTRLWRCGGGEALGKNCGARGTFWNVRAARPLAWPPPSFGPNRLNLVGLTTDRPADTDPEGRWFETIPPERLEPGNLHQAQLRRRLAASGEPRPTTTIGIQGERWYLNDQVTMPGTKLEGLLPNVRMVNATFEDRNRQDFDAGANTDRFLAVLPDYVKHGARAFTFNLQGGMPGYEGALNSAFHPDGTLRDSYLKRIHRVLSACDQAGVVAVLGCFYQRQDQVLENEDAVRRAVVETVRWLRKSGFRNVVLEIANEFDHGGFDHALLRTAAGQIELIRLARRESSGLLVSTSGLGHGQFPDEIAAVADFILIHFNGTRLEDIPARIRTLKKHGKPIVCNEDDRTGEAAFEALRRCVTAGASYGLMLKEANQYQPFTFRGAEDDRRYYRGLLELATPAGESR